MMWIAESSSGNFSAIAMMDGTGCDITDALFSVSKILKKYPITVFVLSAINNTYAELTNLSSKVNQSLSESNLPVGPIIIKAD